jgi:hypothetical protein
MRFLVHVIKLTSRANIGLKMLTISFNQDPEHSIGLVDSVVVLFAFSGCVLTIGNIT